MFLLSHIVGIKIHYYISDTRSDRKQNRNEKFIENYL